MGYNKLVEAYKIRREYISKKIKFILQALGSKQALAIFKTYNGLKQRQLEMMGVGMSHAEF